MSLATRTLPRPGTIVPGRTYLLRPFDPAPHGLDGAEWRCEGRATDAGVQPESPAAILYAARMEAAGWRGAARRLDGAWYGHVGDRGRAGLGVVVHVLEVGDEVRDPDERDGRRPVY